MWVPFPGHTAERRQSVGAPLVGALPRAYRREKTIGRGTPCGCPPQGITPRSGHPLWVPSPGHTAERRQSVGAPLVGALPRAKRREKTIGRGAPCGCPSQGKTPRTVQIIVRSRKFLRSLATGGRFLGRKKKTIGRGAPCGRPSWAIVASEFRCNCPGELLVPLTRSDLRGINGAIPA